MAGVLARDMDAIRVKAVVSEEEVDTGSFSSSLPLGRLTFWFLCSTNGMAVAVANLDASPSILISPLTSKSINC